MHFVRTKEKALEHCCSRANHSGAAGRRVPNAKVKPLMQIDFFHIHPVDRVGFVGTQSGNGSRVGMILAIKPLLPLVAKEQKAARSGSTLVLVDISLSLVEYPQKNGIQRLCLTV